MALEYMDVIKRFVAGKIDIKQLSEFIDDRLFTLRQDPDSMTEEQSILSGIELLICEIKDGFRNLVELEEYAKGLLTIPDTTIFWEGFDGDLPPRTSAANRDVSVFTVGAAPGVRDYFLQVEFA